MRIALKIDVDTRVGTRLGVPRLLDLFRRTRVRATFFVVLGPDNSGWAVTRVFRRKGFVGKMARTNPLAIYGWRTLLSGTVLPAPLTGLAHPEVIRRIVDEGHELALHAYDHVLWQDSVGAWSESRASEELARAVEAFRRVSGATPRAVGAPGWQVSAASLRVQDRLDLDYASDSRGQSPFYPVMGRERFRTLQVPGTLPTADEVLGREGVTPENVFDRIQGLLRPDRTEVFTGHAELEGMYVAEPFARFIERLVSSGTRFSTLAEVAREARSTGAARECPLVQGLVPGRAGPVACQEGGAPASCDR